MSLEDDLHNLRSVLNRAIGDAEAGVSRPSAAARARDGWSRPRVAVAAFLVAAAAAATVGIVTRLDSSGSPGIGIETRHPAGSSSTLEPTTSTTTASTTTSSTPSTTTEPGVALQTVQWSSIAYPITPHCGTVFHPPVTVVQLAYPAPAAGVQLAAVMVRCNAGAGTPPSAVYVYDRATSVDSPHLAATLITDTDGWQTAGFSVDAASISVPVNGFSSSSLPNCCPDVHTTLVWQWNGSGYQLTSPVPAHVKGPAFGGY